MKSSKSERSTIGEGGCFVEKPDANQHTQRKMIRIISEKIVSAGADCVGKWDCGGLSLKSSVYRFALCGDFAVLLHF